MKRRKGAAGSGEASVSSPQRMAPLKAPPKREAPQSPRSERPSELLKAFADEAGPRRKTKIRELSWAEFDRMVQALSRQIQKGFRPEAVIGVAHGGVFVGGAIASATASDFYPVRISRRSRDKVVRRSPRMFGEMPKEIRGKRVLIVDDVAASGETLELACALAAKAAAEEIQTACLVRRTDGYEPHFCSLSSDDFVVFPWDYQPVAEDARFGGDPSR